MGVAEPAQAEQIIERNLTRNFVLGALDGGVFFLGLSMVSRFTVLPLIVERLSGERWMQGLIPMLAQTGWFLPGLFIAPLVAWRPRRKPFLMVATIFERIPFLILGLVLLLAPGWPSGVLLTLLFVLFAMHALSAGVGGIPWQDLIARVIPGNRWGMFFGLQSGMGGLFGVGGAAVAGIVLAQQQFPPAAIWPAGWPSIPPMPFPQNVGALALLCFSAMAISYALLGSMVEPAMPPSERQSIGAFLRGVLPLLRRDEQFRTYLISRMAIALGLLGHSFLTGAALERFGLRNEDVAPFTAALLAAQAAANLLLGWLADRWGHKHVLVLSAALGMAAVVMAIAAPDPSWFLPIFILVGTSQAGVILTGFTMVLSFSPPSDRPAYIGVANTMIAPVSMLGPLLAGWLAEIAGYSALFAVLAVVGLLGAALLHWRVTVPRHEAGAAA